MDDFNEKLEVEILWEFFGLVGVALTQDYVDRQKFESIVPNTLTLTILIGYTPHDTKWQCTAKIFLWLSR